MIDNDFFMKVVAVFLSVAAIIILLLVIIGTGLMIMNLDIRDDIKALSSTLESIKNG